MQPPRLLFQAHNRRGLGHLMRGLNLARAVRQLAPDAAILFYTRSSSTEALCGDAFRYFIEPDPDGTAHWPEVMRSFAPDVTIYDTLLPPGAAHETASAGARSVYIMRKMKADRQPEIFANPALACVDLILIPHTPAEFGYALPTALARKGAFVGPIVRLPDRAAQDRLRAKYGIGPADFVLTSTVGGGGFTEQAESFFATVYEVHRRVSGRLPHLRHLVIQGPNFRRRLCPLPGMTVIEYEPELINLLAISDLVIAEGGYNTVNEIRVAKTPAVFLPSVRNLDDQEERVRALERQGLAAVCADGDAATTARQVAEICLSPTWPHAVRQRYAMDRMELGNRAAAERIVGLVR
jgi:predicted glycosyltransferase